MSNLSGAVFKDGSKLRRDGVSRPVHCSLQAGPRPSEHPDQRQLLMMLLQANGYSSIQSEDNYDSY